MPSEAKETALEGYKGKKLVLLDRWLENVQARRAELAAAKSAIQVLAACRELRDMGHGLANALGTRDAPAGRK